MAVWTGLSITCGLGWSVPPEWKRLVREEQIPRVKRTLRREMDAPSVNCEPIRRMLRLLQDRTDEGWKHRFATTNWDYLLEREIEKLPPHTRRRWLPESFVFHLNGTIEETLGTYRSPFLLEGDKPEQRNLTVEANIIFNQMLCANVVVVAGVSFECLTDRFLLQCLGREEDWMPIGEALWVVVNRNEAALSASCDRIKGRFPRAEVQPVCGKFVEWLEAGFSELVTRGVLKRANSRSESA